MACYSNLDHIVNVSYRTRRYSVEPKTSKYVKGYGVLSFGRNLSNKYGKQLLDTAKQTRLDALDECS